MLKLETITAFTLLLKGAGKAATDQILKDLMKQLRYGLVDKALVVRIASAQVRIINTIIQNCYNLSLIYLVYASCHSTCYSNIYTT